jgi:hypothetical protein
LVWIGQDHLQDLGPALESMNKPKPVKSNAAYPTNIKLLALARRFYVIWGRENEALAHLYALMHCQALI